MKLIIVLIANSHCPTQCNSTISLRRTGLSGELVITVFLGSQKWADQR